MEYCRFFLQSRCAKGASCKYRHETPPTATTISTGSGMPTSRPKKLCSFFRRGACRNGDSCTYSHDSISDTTMATASQSLITCRYFKQGKCLRGSDCPYDHPITAEAGEPKADSSYDSFQREFSGNLISFGDGAAVNKVLMASDFSSVQLEGLPTSSTPASLCQLLQELGYGGVPPSAVYLSVGRGGFAAHITSPDPVFAKAFCSKFRQSQHAEHANLNANIASPRLPSWAASRRVNCNKVILSWEQPTRTVYLKYISEEALVASMVSDHFRNGEFKLCAQRVSAAPPHDNGIFCTVMLKYAPQDIAKQDIEDAIQPTWLQPLVIDLGEKEGDTRANTATSTVELMLSTIGPLEFTLITGPHKRHAKAVAIFMEEHDAREAVQTLQDQPQEFLGGQALSAQLMKSSSARMPRKIYEAVEDQLAACVPEWTEQGLRYNVSPDPGQRKHLITLKVEGSNEKDLARATNLIDSIAAGRVVKDGDISFWSSALMTDGIGSRTLKQIEAQYGVLIIRHKPKRQLQYYGPPELFREVKTAVISQLKEALTKHFALPLSPEHFSWLCRGGFQKVAAALGPGVLSLDVTTNSKKILVFGPDEMYRHATTLLERELSGQIAQAPTIDNCTICFTEPEDPLTLECGHEYCRSCFEGLCSSTGSTSADLSIKCHGEAGACGRTLPLTEMKKLLSSSIFEGVLETSFTRFIQRRPDAFRYCPIADCGSIFRVANDQQSAKPFTCPRCFTTVCPRCFQSHDDSITCEEHKDLSTGGYAAFEKLKKQMNIKDCPRCTTPLEKIDGCNHINCSGCQAHICWVCLKVFHQSGACYQHMTDVHGGNGIEDDLDEEMDD